MKTAHDVIQGLAALGEHSAREIAYEPTGVEPKYHPLLGAAVTPDGRLRYVREGSTPFMIDAICSMGITTQTVLGDSTPYRVNFSTKVHDPLNQVTTGASWAFTAVAAAAYFVLAEVAIDIADSVDWLAADRADMTIQGAVAKDLATWVGIGVEARPSPLVLSGFRGFSLAAGDAIYIRVVQDCGTDRDIDTALSSIIIGHV
jgi:hypothetical protein